MDAGQGDATLIKYPDGSLTLVDCGCVKNTSIVTGEIWQVLDRYLGPSNRLKALVLTHPHADHYNLISNQIVARRTTVDTVFVGGKIDHYSNIYGWLRNQNVADLGQGHCSDAVVPALSMLAGGGNQPVDVRILSANAANADIKEHANPNSIVLLVTYLSVNLFLMGDATALTENRILDQLDPPPTDQSRFQKLLTGKNTALKVGHHGSDTSNTQRWINRISPQVAFISSDTRPFSGVSLPRSAIVQRLFDNTYPGTNKKTLWDYGQEYSHHYVQYNDHTDRHEDPVTTSGLFSTLHLLTWNTQTTFTSYGTTWYYAIKPGPTKILPACTWDKVNVAY